MNIVTREGVFKLLDSPHQPKSKLIWKQTNTSVPASATAIDHTELTVYAETLDRIMRPPLRRTRR